MSHTALKAILACACVAGGLLVASCGGSSSDSGEQTGSGETTAGETAVKNNDQSQPAPTSAPPAKKGIGITVDESQFGEVLFDVDERALYYFDKEKTSRPECYGDCAVAWPPVYTDGMPVGRGGVNDDLLGTTERRDGRLQATYDGRPLYYYVDEPAGQVLCHNVDEFGGLWLAIQPDGQPVS
jgi:predicted lipoprotein with Yx(FWY)xxD motif